MTSNIRTGVVGICLTALLATPAMARAQGMEPLGRTELVRLNVDGGPDQGGPRQVRRQVLQLPRAGDAVLTSAGVRAQATEERRRSVGRRILGGVLGGVGGFFAGGYLGAIIEGDRCHCDDPGLKGALIGAPTGAAIGAILGATFL